MKSVNLVHRWAALILLIGAAAGCQQTNTEQLQPAPVTVVPQADEMVTQLMERALLPGTQQEYDAITAVYKTLTFDQLEAFNKLKSKADEERMVQQLAINTGGRVNTQQRAVVAAQIQEVDAFRVKLNQESVTRYGVPYNQLPASTLNQLLDDQTDSVNPVDLDALANSNARLAPQGCSSASFPYAATKVSNGSQGWSGWTTRSTPNHANDCDYEFRYSGYRYYFDPKDWFADRLCDSFNNRLARRYGSPNTYILFGNRGVWLWIGWPGLTSVNMR